MPCFYSGHKAILFQTMLKFIKQLVTIAYAIFDPQLTNSVYIFFFHSSACFKAPAPPVCPVPCPSACAPSCYDTCCQQGYQQPQVYYPPPPAPYPAMCPNNCPSTCAPTGCTPACCNTVYNQASYPYGKRHHAPKPEKGTKKHHIFRKHHRKN